MIISTKAILINYLKYNDYNFIIEFFTRERGKESFIVSLKKFPKNYFKLLSSYDLEVIISNTREIQKIKNIYLITNYSLYFNNIKSSIIIFLSEFLNKVLPKNQIDYNIFNFIENSINELDKLEEGIANFHLSFILKLTKYLGISFESYFLNVQYNKITNLQIIDFEIFLKLYKFNYNQLKNIKLNKTQRNDILDKLLSFYIYNYSVLSKLKSIDILKEIFD